MDKSSDYRIPLPTTHRANFLAYLTLAAGICTVGFSAIFVRWAGAPGTVTSFYRMAIAALLLTWPFLRGVRSRKNAPRLGVRTAVLGGLIFSGDLALWSTGVVLSGATNPTLLANTAPVWVGLGALIFFRERLSAKFWLGLVLAMSGAMLILGLDALSATTLGLGTLLGLIAAIFYGSYFLITQRGRESLDSLSYTWLSTLSASLALLVLSVLLGHPLTGYTAFSWLNFLALGIVVQVFGWLAINYAQGYLPASIVAPSMLAQPMVTAILAVLLLGETLSLWQALGGVTVLSGVYIVHRSRHRNPKDQETS